MGLSGRDLGCAMCDFTSSYYSIFPKGNEILKLSGLFIDFLRHPSWWDVFRITPPSDAILPLRDIGLQMLSGVSPHIVLTSPHVCPPSLGH